MLCLLLILSLSSFVTADLPHELDAFLEQLFATTECESFLADASFLAVSTRECSPTVCDFPRQLCMRASASYKDERANQCRTIPEECLIAANGGHPLPPPSSLPSSSSPLPSRASSRPPPPRPLPSPSVSTTSSESAEIPSVPSKRPFVGGGSRRIPICEQGPPEGRFCGFALKFAFNRETRSCDQFWFPGCRTSETNENLFDSLAECMDASRHCVRQAAIHRPDQSSFTPNPNLIPAPAVPNPAPTLQPQPSPSNGGEVPFGPLIGQWQNGQAGQFIRMITNTIKEVRERGGQIGGGGGPQSGGGGGFRWDASQLGGLLQSLGRR